MTLSNAQALEAQREEMRRNFEEELLQNTRQYQQLALLNHHPPAPLPAPVALDRYLTLPNGRRVDMANYRLSLPHALHPEASAEERARHAYEEQLVNDQYLRRGLDVPRSAAASQMRRRPTDALVLYDPSSTTEPQHGSSAGPRGLVIEAPRKKSKRVTDNVGRR
jgi:hypothetical protein